jgi:predicted regulator of Ras-like GTPase activity (Roadblock/LC7/MglB family)
MMNEALTGLTELPGVSLAAVVGRDGSIQAASRPDAANSVFASLSSAIFGAVADALQKGGIGPLDSCLLEAGPNALQIQGAGDHVLMALTTREANVGRVKLALKRAADRVGV